MRARPSLGSVFLGGFSRSFEPGLRECPQGALGLQQEKQAMSSMARRMFELVEPIGVIPYSAGEPDEAMFALGFTNSAICGENLEAGGRSGGAVKPARPGWPA